MTSPERKIILIGAQNAGKSTLFNQLTTTHVTTANYAGATVEFKSAPAKASLIQKTTFTDTPGLVSLSGNTPEQKATIDKIFEAGFEADLYLALIDATQLSRQLFLVRQLQEANLPILVCITMIDRLEANGQSLDLTALENSLGLKCLAINNHNLKSVFQVIEAIEKFPKNERKKYLPPMKSESEILEEFKQIDSIVSQVLKGKESTKNNKSDKILLHPVFGILLFITIMFTVFYSIFSLAGYPMDLIDGWFTQLNELIKEKLPEAWYTSLLTDGIINAILAVVIFVPQIIILFSLIGYLEDSGYLARGAMLIDKPLSMIGLNGRSFVPILSGFACAIPAMMAARTIRNRAERLVTIFIIPLMSCSARIPVYIILVSFLTPKDKPHIGALIMTGLYFNSIIMGTVVATVVSKFSIFRKNEKSHFQLELPAMKMPLLKVVFRSTYERSLNYLKKAGPTIILIGISLWFLTEYPKAENVELQNSQTYAAKIGKAIEPVFTPMGIDWRGGVAMIASFAAREVFVNSMMLMYDSENIEIKTPDSTALDEDELSNQKLLERMRNVTFENSEQRIFTTSTVIGLLFFFTIALQCFPTAVVSKNETGSWKIPLLQIFSFTGFAYLGAVIIVQSLRAFGIN